MHLPPKKIVWAFVCVFVGITAVLAWRSLFPPEPVYNGRTLGAWAQQYGSNYWRGGGRPAALEAQAAIRQIGTNGIPFLLDLLRVRDPEIKQKLRSVVAPSWSRRLGLDDRSGEVRRVGAHGLAALGTNAPSAVPALMEIADHHPDEDGRYTAGFALRMLNSAAEPAIPFFIQRLTNSVRIIRDDAAIGLAQIGRQPEVVVPALVRYLESVKGSTGWEVTDAIGALAHFGTNAQAATPVLLSLLNHPDPSVLAEVTNCLPRIDPEAAAKAGVVRPGAIR